MDCPTRTKLVRQYPYATGLKTGSTDEAKFCVSATAEKDGMELIAVILGGENSKQRFQDATKLLNYGFGKCQVYEDNDPPKLSRSKCRVVSKSRFSVSMRIRSAIWTQAEQIWQG